LYDGSVQQTAYDVILMDVQLPEMDGLMATRRIRAQPAPHSDIPILALTANVLKKGVGLHFDVVETGQRQSLAP
jgi:CheY-like chemotaxis protein